LNFLICFYILLFVLFTFFILFLCSLCVCHFLVVLFLLTVFLLGNVELHIVYQKFAVAALVFVEPIGVELAVAVHKLLFEPVPE